MVTTPVAMPESAPEPQAAISPVGRVFGVLFSPKKTYEDIVRKPSWLLPSIIFFVLTLGATIIFAQRVDWREVVSQQIEKNPRTADMPADQKARQIEAGSKFAPIFTYVIGFVVPPVVLLVVCLAMWGAYSLLGGVNPGFGTSFGITAHAYMTSLISTPLFVLVLFLKQPGTIDVENPVATNLAAVLPEDAEKWLVALCKSVDVFVIWTLVLLAIGFAAVNPRKLKGSKSASIAFSVWLFYVVLRVGWAFIFS